MCTQRTFSTAKREVPNSWGQGPAWGPWKLQGLKVIWSIGKGSEIFQENSHLFDSHLQEYYVSIVQG